MADHVESLSDRLAGYLDVLFQPEQEQRAPRTSLRVGRRHGAESDCLGGGVEPAHLCEFYAWRYAAR